MRSESRALQLIEGTNSGAVGMGMRGRAELEADGLLSVEHSMRETVG